MPSNKTTIGIIAAIIIYWGVVASVPALRKFNDPSQIGITNNERCRIVCQVARWWDQDEHDNLTDGHGYQDVAATTALGPSQEPTSTTSSTTRQWTVADLEDNMDMNQEDFTKWFRSLKDSGMDMGPSDADGRKETIHVYPSATASSLSSNMDWTSQLDDTRTQRTKEAMYTTGQGSTYRNTKRPSFWTAIAKALRSAFTYLLYLSSVLLVFAALIAAIAWYAGCENRAKDHKKRLEKEKEERNFEDLETWKRTGFRTERGSLVGRMYGRVSERAILKQSQVHQCLTVHTAFFRHALTHHFTKTSRSIRRLGFVLTVLILPPYILYRVLQLFRKEPHEREDGGRFDGMLAVFMHACVDHPVPVIIAVLVAIRCLSLFVGSKSSSTECSLCSSQQQIITESVNMGKLCKKHSEIEDEYRELYQEGVRKDEEDMIRVRWSQQTASTLPSGEKFSPVPWYPQPLFSASSGPSDLAGGRERPVRRDRSGFFRPTRSTSTNTLVDFHYLSLAGERSSSFASSSEGRHMGKRFL
ncbi:MAG: hypothetical protein Q9218_006230 [Villophora microphyllina]